MPKKQKFTDAELKNMLASGMKQKEIAGKYGMSANGVQARVSKLKKTDKLQELPEPQTRNEIDKIVIGQIVEYHGEKCKVVISSAGRIILNTSSGQKIIKKDEYDCVCGILIKKKSLAPVDEPKTRTVAPENCNGSYVNCLAADTDCEKCEATEKPIATYQTEADPYFGPDGIVEDMPVLPAEDDVKIYAPQTKSVSFADIIEMILERVELTEQEKEVVIKNAEREKKTAFLAKLSIELKERMGELVS